MEAGIDAEVIPGVSTAVAAAEILGIPVTHRGSASSFTVVTGHGAHETAEDFSDLVRLKGTLVFMMAWHKIADIAERLMAAGKPAEHALKPHRHHRCHDAKHEIRYDGG